MKSQSVAAMHFIGYSSDMPIASQAVRAVNKLFTVKSCTIINFVVVT